MSEEEGNRNAAFSFFFLGRGVFASFGLDYQAMTGAYWCWKRGDFEFFVTMAVAAAAAAVVKLTFPVGCAIFLVL